MARSSSPPPFVALLVFAGILLCISLVAIRLFVKPVVHVRLTADEYAQLESLVNGSGRAQEPALESSKVPMGELLSGLGANWTFIDQETFSGSDQSLLQGTGLTRRTHVKLLAQEELLAIYEAAVVDAGSMQQALASMPMQRIGDRDVHILTAYDGKKGFVVQGKTQIVVVFPMSADWSSIQEPLQALVASLSLL